jgi:hypothetical protein
MSASVFCLGQAPASIFLFFIVLFIVLIIISMPISELLADLQMKKLVAWDNRIETRLKKILCILLSWGHTRI